MNFYLLLFLIVHFTNGNEDSLRNLISEKCIKDIDSWTTSLKILSSEIVPCEDTSKSCQDSKKKLVHDHIYSLYQLDSFGKIPSNLLGFNKVWMGDYDECLDVVNPNDKTFQTQFCWAHLNLSVGKILAKSETSVKTMSTTCGAGKPTDLKVSICMPRSCSESELKLALNHLRILPMTTNQYLNNSMDQDKFVCDVTCRPVDFQPDFLFWIVTVVLGTIVLICLFATVFDYYHEIEREKIKELKKTSNEEDDGSLKFLLAFSMLTNGRSLLRISNNPNNLKGVECIRIISFTWVVSGHIWGDWKNADNPMQLIDILKTRSYEIWINAFFSVDTFFFLSGLMLSYSFLPKLTIRKAKSPMIWVIFYWHRILRLTPAYLTFILFYATYGPLTDFGPNEIVQRQDMENCKKYGWKNLLYINNIYEPRKNCLSISWYMAADTQMYLVSPLFLIGFLLGPVPGIIISSLVILFSILLNYWLFFHFDLPLTLIQAYMTGDDHIIHVLQDLVYEAAYIRIPPFIFGICMGYMMLKTRNMKIEMNNGPVFCLWIVSAFLSVSSIFIIHSYNKGDSWTIFQKATYYGFSRIAWSISLCWLIFAVNRGQSGLIGKFMSLPFWTPLGKLTYCAYLCHILIVNGLFNMERSPPHFVGAFHTYITKVVPSVVAACGFAVIWTLVFEMPFAKLESFFIRKLVANPASEKEKQCTKI